MRKSHSLLYDIAVESVLVELVDDAAVFVCPPPAASSEEEQKTVTAELDAAGVCGKNVVGPGLTGNGAFVD